MYKKNSGEIDRKYVSGAYICNGINLVLTKFPVKDKMVPLVT